MIRTDTKAMLPIARPKGSVTGTLPVLISVPATRTPGSRHHRHASRPRTDERVIYLADRQPANGRRKRRLKREVRTTARILTLTAALLFITTFGPSFRVPGTPLLAMPVPLRTTLSVESSNISPPIATPAAPTPEVASTKPERAEDSSVVLLSAEPQLMTAGPDSEIPVILPGYVLPAESYEEPVHEGS